MIEYDPHGWWEHFFDLRGSLVREILLRVLSCVLIAVGVVVADRAGVHLALSDKAHLLLGPALFLLLVFRTNAANERWWEGRKLWGGIVNASRNLARKAGVLLAADPDRVRTMREWTIAFCWATTEHLRSARGLGPKPELSDEARAAALAEDHVPLACARRLTALVDDARRRELVSDIQQVSLDADVQSLVDLCGGCERIRKTPLAFAYVVHLRRALLLYCATLPFTLLATFGVYTPLVTLVIVYVLMGVEELGVEIENPFGDDPNDLPLTQICANIEATLRALPTTTPEAT